MTEGTPQEFISGPGLIFSRVGSISGCSIFSREIVYHKMIHQDAGYLSQWIYIGDPKQHQIVPWLPQNPPIVFWNQEVETYGINHGVQLLYHYFCSICSSLSVLSGHFYSRSTLSRVYIDDQLNCINLKF